MRPQDGVAGRELLRRLDEARGERADDLAHRVRLVDPGDERAGHEAALGALRDQPDAARLDEAHDEAGGAQVGETLGVLEDVDDVLHGARVRERGRGELDDVGLLAARVVACGLLPAAREVVQLLGGVADDADDAAGAARVVAADVALRVGPAQGAVAALEPEVAAVVLAAVLDRLRDQRVQPLALRPRHAHAQGLRVPVVLVGPQVEDLVGPRVHEEPPGVQVPLEAAHAVERQDRVRARGPVVRHAPTVTGFRVFHDRESDRRHTSGQPHHRESRPWTGSPPTPPG